MAARLRRRSHNPGLAIAAIGVALAAIAHSLVGVPLIVAAVAIGIAIGNSATSNRAVRTVPQLEGALAPGLRIAATTILRLGIVMLGLRLSLGDVASLGLSTLAIIAATVATTFFGVQLIGRRMGLSERLSLLVASGFSICGNSAIAAASGALGDTTTTEEGDDDLAAAIGLVTLCGTLAILVLPSIGGALGLDANEFGIWIGASVQDTAQVIAVAAAAGPDVLAIATAVKLTRVLFLAPIVTGISVASQRKSDAIVGTRPPLVPTFVIGFVAAVLLNSAGIIPEPALEAGRELSGYALAMGMVGLGSTVRFGRLRRLGLAPLMLGALAWLVVGGVSLGAVQLLG